MGFEPGYALGDEMGADIFLEGASLEDALGEAKSIYPKHTPLLYDGDLFTVAEEGGLDMTPGREMVPNARDLVDAALDKSGLPYMTADEVMRISEEEAHATLLPYFRRKILSGRYKGQYNQAFDTVTKMKANFMTANAKLDKGSKESKILAKMGIPPGRSLGPNLLPHALVGEISRKKKLSMAGTPNRQINFCVGSNKACRATCLVYSGQNPVADAQVPTKLGRSEALLREPYAWARMFVAACARHERICRDKDLACYVRPNVLSDIPWEMVFPDLFEMLPTISFYDYTKVPGRVERENYDLTFSFSGTNTKQTYEELRAGKRIAVVFWLERPCLRFKAPCDTPADLTFMGRQVIDGDHHDFRPLDPPGSVVGLSYKVPKVKGVRMPKPPKMAQKFVVPTFRDSDTGALIVAGTPAQLGAEEVFEDSAPNLLEET